MRGRIPRAAIVYLATAAAFAVIDLAWLGVMVDRVYRPRLGDVLLDGVRIAPAVAFYLLYVLGIQIFAVRPAVAESAVSRVPHATSRSVTKRLQVRSVA